MKNKKRQGKSVLLISIIVVLIVLILVFVAWNFSNLNNTSALASQCATACETNSKYDYCTKMRTVKDGQKEIETNCATFAVISAYEKFGIEECPLIECGFECTSIMGQGVVKEECSSNEDDITSIANVASGQKCCVPKIM